MKTQLTQTAKDLGFTHATIPMKYQFSKLFIIALMSFVDEIETKLKEEPIFAVQILDKRIEAMELPIQFSAPAKLAAVALTEGNPGRMMVLLIECLTKHPNKVIDPEMLANMYPFGFYNEVSFIDLVDNYMKPKKVMWSEVY